MTFLADGSLLSIALHNLIDNALNHGAAATDNTQRVTVTLQLQAVTRDAEIGKRFVDKLVQVHRLSGQEDWIYIHLEIQGTEQAEFGLNDVPARALQTAAIAKSRPTGNGEKHGLRHKL